MLTFIIAMLISSAFGQQPQPPPDPAFMQKAISALQAQRNQALDALAVSEANGSKLGDEIAKLKAEIEELKKKEAPQ